MPRSPRKTLVRLASLAAGVTLLAGGAIAATTGSARADDTILNVHYDLTGTTTINKLNTTVNLGDGTLQSAVDLTTGTASSTLTFGTATATVKVLGIPISATEEIVQNGSATGAVDLTGNTISSTANVSLKITGLSVAGLHIPVPSSCQTSPFNITVSSQSGFTVGGGGPLSGTYTIPDFHNCGLETLVLDLAISGPGNTINLTLGALQLG